MNVSTLEALNRNRISRKNLDSLKEMLIKNKFLDDLNLSGTGLGNIGMRAISDAFCFMYLE